ncbi:N-acetylglucosamine-6-phosphate deacetylase [Paenibacillus sp. V4I5]|uniref:N-acetylglucosamine-6-phosphate deacetylase n=1 Tax=Paenibacillus sp. V4I5 TaxID=3042306 RepID=UPI0027926E00|nr:amidohydrolase family protein [Paenibacillus sp. V4I5]MDQ0920237.1 N-acetylglucosamine-6-phosphate deacetylase [Paenibacillus sp. V4I5]
MHEIMGTHYTTGESIIVTVNKGIITDIRIVPDDCDSNDQWLIAPGLVDLQMNGCMGIDLNVFPMDLERVHAMVHEVWKEGVTTFFPTITTNSVANISEAMTAIAKACDEDSSTNATIGGIHLEGPFISPENGPRGAHKQEYVCAPNWDAFLRWQEAARGRIRIVTMSPEWPSSTDFIRRCTESGIIVAIGHTAASSEQIRDAVSAGARMATHFGNGAHLTLPRHPNYLWEQLAQDSLWVSLIADGFHLPESFLKVVMRVKQECAILVSDAVHLSGMPPGNYYSHNRVHVVKTNEGRLHLAEEPQLLAGSAQMLPWGIAHLTRKKLCSLHEAWDMASVRPSTLMKLSTSSGLKVGGPADLVRFKKEANGGISICETYKQGISRYAIEAQNDMF